jgi:hypothetical protein
MRLNFLLQYLKSQTKLPTNIPKTYIFKNKRHNYRNIFTQLVLCNALGRIVCNGVFFTIQFSEIYFPLSAFWWLFINKIYIQKPRH